MIARLMTEYFVIVVRADSPYENLGDVLTVQQPEAQQMLVDEFAHRSFHTEVKPRAGQKPMSEVKMLKSDPVAVQAASEDLKARYAKVFRV